jgi:hypothetical protein
MRSVHLLGASLAAKKLEHVASADRRAAVTRRSTRTPSCATARSTA